VIPASAAEIEDSLWGPQGVSWWSLVGLGTLLLAAATWLLPSAAGVTLLPAERLLIVGVLAGVGALIAALSALLAGTRRKITGAVPVLLPTAVALALAVAPRTGKIHVRVEDEWIGLVVSVALVLAILARTRAAPVVVGLIGCWSVVAAGVVLFDGGRDGVEPALNPASHSPAAHIVLITLDTVRADHFDFVRAESSPVSDTPSLSALADESVVFRQAFSTSALTGPSHATLLSGLDSPTHGVWSNGDPLAADIPWVPEILAANGWRTRAAVSAAVLDASLGFDRGFRRFDSTFERRLLRGHPLTSFLGFRPHRGSSHRRSGMETVRLIGDLDASQRTFTWVHLYDAHWPYQPSSEAAARHGLADPTPLSPLLGGQMTLPGRPKPTTEQVERGKALYRAGIDDLDRVVGSLLDSLPPGAAVVVVGDHGESLGEQGIVFNHGSVPYSSQTHVPLMVRGDGWHAGAVDTVVSLVDVAPTLLHLAGLEPPVEMLGRSLALPAVKPVVSHVRARSSSNEEQTQDHAGGIAVRKGRWSVVAVGGAPPALFDRSSDPLELAPLPLPPGHELESQLRAERLKMPGETAGQLDEETRAMLQSLGYVE